MASWKHSGLYNAFFWLCVCVYGLISSVSQRFHINLKHNHIPFVTDVRLCVNVCVCAGRVSYYL